MEKEPHVNKPNPAGCSNPLERVRAETHRGHEEGEGREHDVQRQPVELAPEDVGGGGADHKQVEVFDPALAPAVV